MNDHQQIAAMLRAVLNLEQWPTDVLAGELRRLLDIAGLELAPAGSAATVADALAAEPAPCWPLCDCNPEPDDERSYPPIDLEQQRRMAIERNARAGGTLEPVPGVVASFAAKMPRGVTFSVDPRVEMDARTRRVSAGLEPAPPGVVTTFAAVPDAAMPRCAVCSHLDHGSAVCGTRVPLTWGDSIDARVPDTCQCEGEPPAPAEPEPEPFPDHIDETCRLGRDAEADADATLRRYRHRVFLDIGLEGVGATLELDRFHIAGARMLLTEAQRHQ